MYEVRLPRSRLATLQVVEYFRAFLVGRVGWSRIGALLIISGAFGLFRRSLVEAVGGYATDTVGEDMELVVRLHRQLRGARRAVPDRVHPRPGLLDRGAGDDGTALAPAAALAARSRRDAVAAPAHGVQPRYGPLGVPPCRTSCCSSCSAR